METALTLPTILAVPTTAEILSVLAGYHAGDEWAFFKELAIGTGFGRGVPQRLDAWAMHLWPSHHYTRWTFEVKISRGDFLRELAQPLKRRPGLLYSNLFYFVTPAGLVKPAEIPAECGLIEVGSMPDDEIGPDGPDRVYRRHWTTSANRQWVADIIVPAPWRDTSAPSWGFFASIARRAMTRRSDET